jgi:hypothetical protein
VLHAGDRKPIAITGPTVVRLGNVPHATLALAGTPLDLSHLGQTADLHVQVAPA